MDKQDREWMAAVSLIEAEGYTLIKGPAKDVMLFVSFLEDRLRSLSDACHGVIQAQHTINDAKGRKEHGEAIKRRKEANTPWKKG